MKLYVSTYAKYNNGSLFGKWIDLNDYVDHDDFIEACKELHSGELHPELMFQDFEGFPDDFYCECDARPAFEYKTALADSGMDKEAFDAGIELGFTLDAVADCYCGEYESEADYAETLCEDCGELQAVPDALRNCIDFQRYWNVYLRFDYTVFNGHVFRDA